MTYSQRRRKPRVRKVHKGLKALKGQPQREGMCTRIVLRSPKKPNSANRAVALIRFKGGEMSVASVPGIGHSIGEYNTCLVRGGRSKDLPGVQLTVIRGPRDIKAVPGRKTSMSKYGTQKMKDLHKSIFFQREKNKLKQRDAQG